MSAQYGLPALSADGGLRRYLAEIRKFPLLEKEEEYMLAKRWADRQDTAAAHDLVTSHLRLAAKIAMGYRGYGLPIADVISEANVGLMQAVKKFNPEMGVRLATYAMWWIRAHVTEYVLRSWSLVKLGTTRSQKKLFFNLRRARERIGAQDGALNDEQAKRIGDNLNVPASDVLSMDARLAGRDHSLNQRVGRDDGGTLEWQDTLADESADHVEELADSQEKAMRRKLLQQAIGVLDEREAEIFKRRRLAERPCTLEVLSKKYDVSRERIRQIEEKAFGKVRARVAELAREQGMPAESL